MHLDDSLFLKNNSCLNGLWLNQTGNLQFDVTDPANEKLITRVPNLGNADRQNVI